MILRVKKCGQMTTVQSEKSDNDFESQEVRTDDYRTE